MNLQPHEKVLNIVPQGILGNHCLLKINQLQFLYFILMLLAQMMNKDAIKYLTKVSRRPLKPFQISSPIQAADCLIKYSKSKLTKRIKKLALHNEAIIATVHIPSEVLLCRCLILWKKGTQHVKEHRKCPSI